MKPLFQAHHTNTWPWTWDIHASTNLLAHDPASSNLSTRNPTLRTSPPVVQHMWFNNYEPPHSHHPSSVSTEYRNLPIRILTREHHNMNLPTHIITCSTPVMNLPAHGTIKHLLVQVHITTIKYASKKSTLPFALSPDVTYKPPDEMLAHIAWRNPLVVGRQTKIESLS